MIGLSRSYWASAGQHSGPALLDALYQSRLIQQRVFAIHFDDLGGSTLEFGGYNADHMARGRELIYLEAPYAP